MPRFTILTSAYANNKNYLEISAALRDAGHTARTFTAIDGEVSIETNAPADFCENLMADRPMTVSLAL